MISILVNQNLGAQTPRIAKNVLDFSLHVFGTTSKCSKKGKIYRGLLPTDAFPKFFLDPVKQDYSAIELLRRYEEKRSEVYVGGHLQFYTLFSNFTFENYLPFKINGYVRNEIPKQNGNISFSCLFGTFPLIYDGNCLRVENVELLDEFIRLTKRFQEKSKYLSKISSWDMERIRKLENTLVC